MTSAILLDERKSAIQARLLRDGRVIAADLARDFATSEDTIRRDLRELAAAGLCRRVYGGALPLSPASGTLAEREHQNAAGKLALGRAAAALVRPGQLLFIDAGSTNLCIARALPADLNLTVATNAPSIAMALAGNPGVGVIVIGGRLDPRSGGTLGAKAVGDAQRLRPDLYFIGACAVARTSGVAVFDAEEAELKHVLAEASATLVAAADDTKLGTAAPYLVAAWADLDHLVVETPDSPSRCAAARGPGPAFHIAATRKAGS
jgi:DeoR/GlpR family transcriptional regulator of sugar metabolism